MYILNWSIWCIYLNWSITACHLLHLLTWWNLFNLDCTWTPPGPSPPVQGAMPPPLPIRLVSGRFTSYWKAFLFTVTLQAVAHLIGVTKWFYKIVSENILLWKLWANIVNFTRTTKKNFLNKSKNQHEFFWRRTLLRRNVFKLAHYFLKMPDITGINHNPFALYCCQGPKLIKRKGATNKGRFFDTLFVLCNNIVNWNGHEVHPLKKKSFDIFHKFKGKWQLWNDNRCCWRRF